MTCHRYERDLALAVEGDLPERPAARLERHVQRCPHCRDFLQGLKGSQRKLKGLAAERVDEAALATVRTRVVAALHEPAPRRGVPAWGWALAASLAVVALALAMVVWRPTPGASRQTAGLLPSPPAPKVASVTPAVPVERPGVASTRRSPVGAAVPPSRHLSTARPVRAVSRGVEPERGRAVPELSPDDADQLARAVVAVSRIRRLGDRPPAAATEPSPAGMVRLETADPGVVIYWQLDSNGG